MTTKSQETPSTTNPSQPALPTVHQAVSAVMRDIASVGKGGYNDHHKYKFRAVEDMINAAHGALSRHGVLVVPSVTNKYYEVRGGKNTTAIFEISYTWYGPAGDHFTHTLVGEASDTSDKAANKAMSAGLKYALMHTLMIPTEDMHQDADQDSPTGARSPLDSYIEQMRDGRIWNDPTALEQLLKQAEAEQMTGQFLPVKPGNEPMTLGTVLSARLTQLTAAADAA